MQAAQPDIARRVTQLREARGWSQADLAAEAGVTRSYLSRLEGGDYREPSVWKLQLIAEALGLTVLDLIAPETGHPTERLIPVPAATADAILLLKRFKLATLRMLESVGDAFEGQGPPRTPVAPARTRRANARPIEASEPDRA